MDCTNARMLLSLAGRECQELAPSDQRLLDDHLEGCPECAAAAQAEQQLDQVLGRAMLAVAVPSQLRAKILNAVARPRKPRLWPWLTAAASVLLAVGLVGYGFLKPGAKFDIEEYVYHLDRQTASGPEIVESSFQDQGVALAAPRQFRYAYLEGMNVQVLQGQKVGHLFFHFPGTPQHPSAVAHVYVLPSRFVHRAEQVSSRFPTSTHTIEFLPQVPVGRNEFVYMVVYTGPSLDPFLLRGHAHEG